MKYSIFLSLLLLHSFVQTFCQSKKETDDVIKAERDIMSATLAGDTSKLNALFADTYKGYFESEEMNKDFILKNYTHALTGITAKDMAMDGRTYGNAAVLHGIWQLQNGKDKPRYFQLTDMFILKNKLWQLVSAQQNPIPVWKARNNLDDNEFVTTITMKCDTASMLKSLNSDVPAFLRIKNNTSEKLTTYWINYDGLKDTSADQIRYIEAGKFIDIQTFLTHPFIVTDINNKCYGIYEAKAEPTIAIIKN